MKTTASRTTLKVLLWPTVLVLLVTPVFWLTDLDLSAAGYWYNNGWPAGKSPIWQFFYHAIPVLSLVLAVTPLLILALSCFWERAKNWRKPAVAVFLTMLIGPGILVNAIFKENWGRPRPAQVDIFQGQREYLPPLKPAFGEKGKAFPCGHCSVSFSMAVFPLMTSHPYVAAVTAGGTLIFGALTGTARMAAGGHFLSDVIWSAWMSFLAAWLSLRIVNWQGWKRYAFKPSAHRIKLATGAVVVGALVAGGALLATPVDSEIRHQWQADALPKTIFIEEGLVTVTSAQDGTLTLEGKVSGFGWPGSTVKLTQSGSNASLTEKGLFTEHRAQYQVSIPPAQASQIEIRVKNGRVTHHK